MEERYRLIITSIMYAVGLRPQVEKMIGQEKVFFFPSSYRRAVKYGQRDAANEILRTEVLARLSSGGHFLIVTYPDGLIAVENAGLHQDGDDAVSFQTDFVHSDFCCLQGCEYRVHAEDVALAVVCNLRIIAGTLQCASQTLCVMVKELLPMVLPSM